VTTGPSIKPERQRREAARRVLGLGLLEYIVLSIGALAASILLFFRLDGKARERVT